MPGTELRASRLRRGPFWRGQAPLLVLVVLTLLAGCGSPARSAGISAARRPSGTTSRRAGCGQPVVPGSSTLHLTVAGHQRIVVVHVPSSYRGSTPVALVLNLHGSGSTARAQEAFSGMDAAADQDGFIVAYPQGLLGASSGFDWNVPGVPLVGGALPPRGAADDVAFLTDLVPALSTQYCIDPARVYATGMSGGGRMASQLACDAPATFAAVAPVAGLRFPAPCPSSQPVAVIAFHGTADPVDPYDGRGEAYWTYSVATAAQRWGAHDGCRPGAQTSSATGYTLTSYAGCADGSSVELYAMTGEGHQWPGGPPVSAAIRRRLGPQTDAVDADALMWAFFAAHPRS